MSTENKKTLIVVGVIALIVGLALGNLLFGSRVAKLPTSGSDFAGAVGNLLAEDYDPYVQYNGGFNTAKGITNSGTLTQSGASTFSGTVSLTSTLTVGSSGTALNRVNAGFCDLSVTFANRTIGSWEMKTYDCASSATNGQAGKTALTGVAAGDEVYLNFATTTTAAVGGSLRIMGVSASSTQGFITVNIVNASTTPVSLTSAATSSLNYSAIDN